MTKNEIYNQVFLRIKKSGSFIIISLRSLSFDKVINQLNYEWVFWCLRTFFMRLDELWYFLICWMKYFYIDLLMMWIMYFVF